MRILILNWKDTANPLAGGAEVFTEAVAECLVARGHDVTLFTSSVAGQPEEETRSGVAIIRRGGRLSVYREARGYWNEPSRKPYDVVIDEINTRPFMTPRWIRDTPIVALIHQLAREIWSYEMPFPVSALGRHVLEPWWLRAYRNVPALTVSRSSARSLAEHHAWRDITVVPEGWSPHDVPALPKEENPTVVFLGRLVAMKRPEHALRAFEILARSHPSAQLWIIGDGPLRPKLEQEVGGAVSVLGRIPTDEVVERLVRAHVLVATSIREGWGLGVSEAAVCGTPTIGYSTPGLVDSIPASGGALVEPSPDALGGALVRFFRGELRLKPQPSLRPWPEVAAVIEARLKSVVEAFRSGTRR
jgi:glycosyltransferase involved in cell wall biosynthesis